MTKEEYHNLLNSDYWKGFSYSLIKERNFTCEDCGRQFPNERNKLHVHHLVYRDTNPWSYAPHEMVVLCKECHMKRHGIVEEPARPLQTQQSNTYAGSIATNNTPSKNKSIWIILLVFFLLLTPIYLLVKNDRKYHADRSPKVIESQETVTTQTHSTSRSGLMKMSTSNNSLIGLTRTTTENNSSEKSSLELIEERNHADVVERAKRAGVSTEGSTLDILERLNHVDVIEQAKRAGVSTEGSTLDILERINHADAVRNAKEKGVSTEGSTLDILERINHADAVKLAKEKGVSTQGSTLDILERIHKAELSEM